MEQKDRWRTPPPIPSESITSKSDGEPSLQSELSVAREPSISSELRTTSVNSPPMTANVRTDEGYRNFFSKLMLANSWFASLVIHLVLFILLSLATYSIHQGTSLEIELAQSQDEQPALTLESFDSPDSNDGSDLDAEMEQLLASNNLSAELDFTADPVDFDPSISMKDAVGLDDMTSDATSSLMSDANRRMGSGNDAQFFGIQATGRNFVFIVDSSGSMSGKRWRNAVRELGNSLSALHEEQQFYVIFFDATTHLMFAGQSDEFRRTKKLKMLKANKPNLRKAKRWFSKIRLGQQTAPRVSFDYGLSLKPDAIFFLTDGQFNDGTYEFLMEVAAQSEKKPTINTVAFGNKMAAITLEKIAARFNGKHQFVK